MSSKFREHLSIKLPHPNDNVEKSKFSPASTITPSRVASSPTDIEAGLSPSPSFRDRFTKMFFDFRTLSRDSDTLPIQEPHLSQWPPLHVQKRRCTCHHPEKKKHNRRSCCLTLLLVIILLWLIGNIIFLNIRVLSMSSPIINSPANASTTSTAYSLSPNAQQCLSQYTLNAPSAPSSYPCSTCLPTFQAVPSTYISSNPQNAQQIINAIQFCGLRGIFDTANSQGQATLGNSSWVQDVKFCAWNGVTCDGSGRVANLTLTFPGVPATLPSELGALTGLESLQVIGGDSIPAGALPSSFTNLTSLSNLHLEATAITALPSNLFSSLKAVTTLTLVRNTMMGSSLPSTLTQLPLQNLVINSQQLTNPLSSLSSSSSLQASLQLLDLSSTSLTGTIPSTISSFSALTQLLLSNNNLQAPLPSNFSPSLQILSLQNNTALTGTVPSSLCSSAQLKSCSLQSTGLNATGGCGSCQF
ncbi:RNI-like protein [Rhizopogon vinicolor AM-OR11-026]|uniref:RNI-like protein n=1 Tax=Rhizopogon vinicolor AM-OR11-026 TaxID=1314800 RepID=A0A1B7ND86_9AGAM|nr:RNI-like protein [Rhizopogon vinicolor AM-OR11-026]